MWKIIIKSILKSFYVIHCGLQVKAVGKPIYLGINLSWMDISNTASNKPAPCDTNPQDACLTNANSGNANLCDMNQSDVKSKKMRK